MAAVHEDVQTLLVQVINNEVQDISGGAVPVVASNSHLGMKTGSFGVSACIDVKLFGLEELKSHEFKEFKAAEAADRTSSISSGSSGDWTSICTRMTPRGRG